MPAERDGINCFRCAHYYVTWDEHFPKGCKALGFKSREVPSSVVLRSSGMECLKFEERDDKGGAKG